MKRSLRAFLYFNNDKDVSAGNTNVLTANTWTAVSDAADAVGGSVTANYLNLKTADGKFLVVDTAFWEGTGTDINTDAAYKLNVDTVFAKDYGVITKNTAAARRVKDSYEFQPVYSVAEDSLILKIAKVPAYQSTADLTNNSHWTSSGAPATATTYAGQIILRNLANATVLTVEKSTNVTTKPYVVQPLIQPTPSNLGGTAKITPNKVYYVADMRTYVSGAQNPGYGKFYDYNFPSQTNYLEAGQPFNYFSQFVVESTPGTETGNYIIKARVNGTVAWSGVADSLANGNIVFGPDTIKLVDAGLEYTGETQYIGYRANDHALANKQFKIQSASPLLSEDMFLHMKTDSTMTLSAGEVLYSMERINTRSYAAGAIKDAVDPLAWDVYAIKTDKGEYLIMNEDGEYILTADPEKYNYTVTYQYTDGSVKSDSKSYIATGFAFIPTEAADKYVIMPTFPRITVTGANTLAKDKIKVECYYSSVPGSVQGSGQAPTETTPLDNSLKNSMVTVNTNTGDLENATLGDVKYDLFYVAEEEDPQSLFTMPKHVTLNTSNNEFVAINGANQGVVVAENALKSDVYTTEDFTFWLDTAKYYRNGETEIAPQYYLTKGVAADSTTNTEAYRLYMYNAADSAKNATVDKEQYTAYDAVRVIFREASRYGADSLIVANDTLTIDGKATATIAKPKAGVNDFRFKFLQAEDEAEGVYNIVSVKDDSQYLRNLNGVLVLGTEIEGVKVTVENAQAPTANDEITASEVTVIAGNGQITISGAAGKQVVVSNILGQVVANTVLTSDNATIAAPQGVVVVAVEGEEAVKAIVK